MSLPPPKQRPGESDLEWAMRVWEYNFRATGTTVVLGVLSGLMVLVIIVLLAWRLA